MSGVVEFGAHIPSETNSVNGGVQHKFKFSNGYGASVVCHSFSYGGDRGLWELAVLGLDGDLTYSTPVTNDVLGYLNPADVIAALDQIEALTEDSIAAAKRDRADRERQERIAELRAELARLEAEVSA